MEARVYKVDNRGQTLSVNTTVRDLNSVELFVNERGSYLVYVNKLNNLEYLNNQNIKVTLKEKIGNLDFVLENKTVHYLYDRRAPLLLSGGGGGNSTFTCTNTNCNWKYGSYSFANNDPEELFMWLSGEGVYYDRVKAGVNHVYFRNSDTKLMGMLDLDHSDIIQRNKILKLNYLDQTFSPSLNTNLLARDFDVATNGTKDYLFLIGDYSFSNENKERFRFVDSDTIISDGTDYRIATNNLRYLSSSTPTINEVDPRLPKGQNLNIDIFNKFGYFDISYLGNNSGNVTTSDYYLMQLGAKNETYMFSCLQNNCNLDTMVIKKVNSNQEPMKDFKMVFYPLSFGLKFFGVNETSISNELYSYILSQNTTNKAFTVQGQDQKIKQFVYLDKDKLVLLTNQNRIVTIREPFRLP